MKTITIENDTIVVDKIVGWKKDDNYSLENVLLIYVFGIEQGLLFVFDSEEEREEVIKKLHAYLRDV